LFIISKIKIKMLVWSMNKIKFAEIDR
jgi:hypothetical protein